MTSEQKRCLAALLIDAAGNLVEIWEETVEHGVANSHVILADVPARDAAHQLGEWLKKLPGIYWDTRLD